MPLPDADLCAEQASRAQQRCYNLLRDYEIAGSRVQLKPGAQPHMKPLRTTSDVEANVCADAHSFAAIKSYMQSLQDKCVCK